MGLAALKKPNIESRILEILEKKPLTIEEISKTTKLNRVTVSKYLAVMEAGGLVKYAEVGNAKLFSRR